MNPADGIDGAPLPEAAWLAALLGLSDMGPRRLLLTLAGGGGEAAWRAVVTGRLGHRLHPIGRRAVELAALWQREARCRDVAEEWQRYRDASVGVTALGSPGFPAVFDDDPEPPAVLFHQGSLDAIAGARVGIVGTRRCTRYGRDVAFEIGAGLAAAGVAVVSGLALGIDACAHAGAISVDGAPPIAVVGSGLDVVYPKANRGLWADVAARGVVLSEAPLGTSPARWRFPARNRLIAALSDVVVVVESHEAGGSLSTVAEAVARDRPVLAVPGSVRSPASRGTNALLADGAGPAGGVEDVLIALGMSTGAHRRAAERRPPVGAATAPVLEAVGWHPSTTEQVVLRTGRSLGEVALAIDELVRGGWLSRREGWLERVSADRAGLVDAPANAAQPGADSHAE